MPTRRSLLKPFAIAITLPFFISPVHAQSALEKAFVSKSKLISSIWRKHDPSSASEVDHSLWDAFLGKYVSTDGKGINRVAYGQVSASDKAALKDYINLLQATDVPKLNRNEQYAFWFNLYNANMLNVNLQNYPIKSVFDIKKSLLDVKGPFNDKITKVMGQTLTLDEIESGIVRPIWNDPLLHYGFNCAAISCPNLAKQAYRGATVKSQLQEAAISYVNDRRGVSITGGKVTASKIYFWYSGDFGKSEKSILKHISRFAKDDLKSNLAGKTSINAYQYDWALNDQATANF